MVRPSQRRRRASRGNRPPLPCLALALGIGGFGLGVIAGCKKETSKTESRTTNQAPAATTKTADGWVVFTPSSRAFTVESPEPMIEFPGDPGQPGSVIYQLVAKDGAYAFTIARWDIKAKSTGDLEPKAAMSTTFTKLARQYGGSWDGEVRALPSDGATILAGTITNAKLPGGERAGTVEMRWYLANGITHQLQAIIVDPEMAAFSQRFLESFRLVTR